MKKQERMEQGTRSKEQGTRSKEQGTRSKEQGARNKEQGTRNKDKGTVYLPPPFSFLLSPFSLFLPPFLLSSFLLFSFFLPSCSTTQSLSEEQYLLDKVSLKTDSTEISKINLMDFIRQKPNSPKIGLMIYNLVDSDSAWIKRMIRKIGEAPVIYNANSVNQTVNELSIETKNQGYLNSHVHAVVDTTGKKISVDYHLHEGIPYRIRNYTLQLPERQRNSIREESGARRNWLPGNGNRRPNRDTTLFSAQSTVIKPGTIFDMRVLEQEINRVSVLLRNQGYYSLTVDNLHYLADTTLRSNQVDLTLLLKDSANAQVYRVEKVKVFSGYDPLSSESYTITDSLVNKDIEIYYNNLHFLRSNVIADKIRIRPGSPFRDRAGESTLSLFQSMSAVGRADVAYKEGNYPDSTLLDCEIYLTPGEIHAIQTGLSGTNKAGDLGVAFDVKYNHQNLFNGAELFNIDLKAAYEFVNGKSGDNSLNNNFYELGITPSLAFPNLHLPFVEQYLTNRYNVQTRYSLGLDIQRRPEFVRDFFNFNWQFRWSGRNNIVSHSVSLLDINYVAMPWKSEEFQHYLDTEVDPLTKYSYENVFTAGANYNFIYTNTHSGKIRQHLYTVRFNAESSGNALHGIFSLSGAQKTDAGQYNLFGNPFAQYVKSDIDFSETLQLNPSSGLAFHAGLGVAHPYDNSTILPFEKRYYAGGPNSIRGWRTRYLGPGAFNQGISGDPTTHVGDISFIVSAEYRYKVLEWLEPAFFVDCGNIWTIRDYSNQPDGLFRWDTFYKELAVGTGIGLRFDLGFFVLRLDAGTKVYDPARPEGNRLMLFKENLWHNSAAYIAIGYPF
jgi:outer membrane protein assembly factor BamA